MFDSPDSQVGTFKLNIVRPGILYLSILSELRSGPITTKQNANCFTNAWQPN